MTALAIPLLSFYSSPSAPAANAAGEEQVVTVELTYYCESVTNFDMPVKITATAPTSLEPGEENYSANSYTEVTIPANVVDILRDILQVEAVSGKVTRFDVSSENTNKTINVAELYDIDFPYTETPSSGGITVRVPETGGLDVGPFVAGESGEMVFKAGQIDTALMSHGVLGDTELPASCYPKPGEDNTIVTIPIVAAGEDPPAEDPPGEDPPAEDPPGEDPPAEDPPGEDPPAEDPPAEDPPRGGGTDGDGTGGDRNGNGIGGDRTGTDDSKKGQGLGGVLPKTATSTPFLILLGSLIAISGGALVFFRKKKVMTE